MKKILIFSLFLFVTCIYGSPPPTAAEVFKFNLKHIDPNTFLLEWKIKKGYFLYKDRIYLSEIQKTSVNIGELRFPKPIYYKDNLGKKYEIYRNTLQIPVSVLGVTNGQTSVDLHYQGCSDSGFCYPPQCFILKLTIDSTLALTKATITTKQPLPNIKKITSVATQDQLTRIFFNNNLAIIIISFFSLGLLLSLTPCILPMVPVLSGIIVGHGKNISTKKAFLLSLTYVLSMSITYAIAGAIVALMGHNIQVIMQSPWSISIFSLIFVLLALSMFDIYEFRLPISWQAKLANVTRSQHSGHFISAAIMGSLSTLILSPCVTPPLIGALGYISQTGNITIGALALFFLSFGMGVPLLIIGASAGKLLPHTGKWMLHVKSFFGIVLICIAISLLARILPIAITMFLCASLLIILSIYLGIFEKANSHGEKFSKSIAIILFIYGVIIMIGIGEGNQNLWQPLSKPNHTPNITTGTITIRTLKEAEDVLANSLGMPIILDFYADWCTTCIILEKTMMQDPQVHQALLQFKVIKVDVTNNNRDSLELLNHFKVVAPPTFIFINKNGEEIPDLRLVGDVSAATFYANLEQARLK